MISMHTEILKADHPVAFQHAVDVLKNGGLIVFPTDTVYGLAAWPYQAEFVERLYVVKGRNSTRAIAVLIARPEDMNQVAISPSESAMKLARRFWPGPLTIIMTKHPNLPDALSPQPTIGIRMPDHKVAIAILNLSGPLAVTSANLSGQENTTTAQEALAQLEGKVHLIIDGGKSPGGVPSTVVDCTKPEPEILRSGPISEAEIKAELGY
jgi:L-threonylcarbamoyladenylate synthase